MGSNSSIACNSHEPINSITTSDKPGFAINITAGATLEESSVTATGQLIHIITDSERSSFGIGSDADLKHAVGNYFGKQPNDAYLYSPTPWNDLYKTYGWPQVQVVLEPKKAKILSVNTKPTIVKTENLTNKSSNKVTFSAEISQEVSDSVSNTWENSSKVSFEQSIKYNIGFLGIGGGGETKFGFEQTWGSSETVTKMTTVSSISGVTVEVNPGGSAQVELIANKGTLVAQITYEAHLTGDTAINYNPEYKDHHFFGLSIGDVLKSSNSVLVVEDIEVGYYCNTYVTVIDGKTMEKMMFHLADYPHE